MLRTLFAEVFGTFWLVLAIVGTANFAAGVPEVGVGWIGVSFAAGIAIVSMAYAVGGISGGHFNPAVSLGLAIAGRFSWSSLLPYWAAQLAGGIAAAVVVYAVGSGSTDWVPGGFASNGFDTLSPMGFSLVSVFIAEVVLTALFLIVILGSTSAAAPVGFAPLAIGLCLAAMHIVGIPISNASFNPARSTAAALFSQQGHLMQLWMFWLAPLVGGALGAAIWRYILSPGESPGRIGRVS